MVFSLLCGRIVEPFHCCWSAVSPSRPLHDNTALRAVAVKDGLEVAALAWRVLDGHEHGVMLDQVGRLLFCRVMVLSAVRTT